MNIPQTLTAGDTVSWSDDPWTSPAGQLYTPPGYALTYELRGPGAPVTLNAAQAGTGWHTTLAADVSANLAAGLWWWVAVFTKPGERISAGKGEVRVVVDLASITGAYDGRTQAEKDLAAVEAAISARATGGVVLEYSIAGRSLKREPTAALLSLRSLLLIRVRNEQSAASIAAGLGNPRNLHVRFRS